MRWNRMILAMGCCLAIAAGHASAQELQQTSAGFGLFKKWRQKPHCPVPNQECPVHPPLYIEPHVPPTKEPEKTEEPVEPVMPIEPMPTDMVAADTLSQAPLGGTTGGQSAFPNIFGDAFASDRGISDIANSTVIGGAPTTARVLNPSEGVVGRQQIAEEASPIPTDRIYFIYDYFNNVPIVPGDIDVHRYVLGIEKTFLNGLVSIDMRLPWATTLNTRISPESGFHTRDTELGNLLLVLKGMLIRSDNFGVSGGMGIHVPTGNDTRVFSPAGQEMVRIDNQSVILTPFIAGYWTNQTVFAQAWTSVDFDTEGNPVLARPIGAPSLTQIGRLNSQDLIQVDAQIGAWLYRNNSPGALLRGVAPFVEFHYSSTHGNQDTVRGFGNIIGDFANHIDEYNLSTGVIMAIGEQSSVSVGAVLPLNDEYNRSFDYQIGVRANFRFGVTALTNPFGAIRY